MQSTTDKIKDLTKRTPQETGDDLVCSWRVSSAGSTSGICRVTVYCGIALILLNTHFIHKGYSLTIYWFLIY